MQEVQARVLLELLGPIRILETQPGAMRASEISQVLNLLTWHPSVFREASRALQPLVQTVDVLRRHGKLVDAREPLNLLYAFLDLVEHRLLH